MDKQDKALYWMVWAVRCYVITCTAFGISGLIRVYQLRNELFMQKRHLSTVFGQNVSIIIGIMSTLGLVQGIYDNNISMSYQIYVGLHFASWFLMFLFLLAKSFMIHFRYKWQYYRLQSDWQKLINPNIIQELQVHNWYIRQYHIWTKLSNVYKLFGAALLINFAVGICIMQLKYSQRPESIRIFAEVIYMIILVFPFIIYCVIVSKTPSSNDTLYLHYELTVDTVLLLMLVITYITANVTVAIKGKVMVRDLLVFVVVEITILSLLIAASTYLVIVKNKKKASRKHSANMCANRPDIKLDSVLKSPQGVNLFMNHLKREWSTECLLAYIEFDQYQKLVMKQTKTREINKSTSTLSAISPQPDIETMKTLRNVPKSDILTRIATKRTSMMGHISDDDMFLNDMKKRAHLLYHKYIRIGTEFETNIPAGMRTHLIEILADKNKLMKSKLKLSELVLLFEPPKKEMRILLNYSFARMKTTDAYMELAQI